MALEPLVIAFIVLFSLIALSILAALCRIAYVRCEDWLFSRTITPRYCRACKHVHMGYCGIRWCNICQHNHRQARKCGTEKGRRIIGRGTTPIPERLANSSLSETEHIISYAVKSEPILCECTNPKACPCFLTMVGPFYLFQKSDCSIPHV